MKRTIILGMPSNPIQPLILDTECEFTGNGFHFLKANSALTKEDSKCLLCEFDKEIKKYKESQMTKEERDDLLRAPQTPGSAVGGPNSTPGPSGYTGATGKPKPEGTLTWQAPPEQKKQRNNKPSNRKPPKKKRK